MALRKKGRKGRRYVVYVPAFMVEWVNKLQERYGSYNRVFKIALLTLYSQHHKPTKEEIEAITGVEIEDDE